MMLTVGAGPQCPSDSLVSVKAPSFASTLRGWKDFWHWVTVDLSFTFFFFFFLNQNQRCSSGLSSCCTISKNCNSIHGSRVTTGRPWNPPVTRLRWKLACKYQDLCMKWPLTFLVGKSTKQPQRGPKWPESEAKRPLRHANCLYAGVIMWLWTIWTSE